MPVVYLLEGIVIGFLLAVPIGAVGILCLRTTLNAGRRQGMIVGFAGATADLFLSAVSAFGIRLIFDFITAHQYEIRIAGGIVIIAMGIFLVRSRRVSGLKDQNIIEQSKVYFSTLLIALTNPLVVFGYAGVMTAVGATKMFSDYWSLSVLVVGVFFGSLLWFFSISSLVHRFRFAVTEERLALVNRIAGVLLVIIGSISIWAGIQGMR